MDSADVFDEIKELAEEYKDINIITDFLQYVRDNADNYDADNGWDLSDLIDLSIKFCDAEEYNNGWIPCDKEVPEVNLRVLLSLKNGDVWLGSYDGYKYDLIGLGYVTMNSVLAWQPLPHKYEPKGE